MLQNYRAIVCITILISSPSTIHSWIAVIHTSLLYSYRYHHKRTMSSFTHTIPQIYDDADTASVTETHTSSCLSHHHDSENDDPLSHFDLDLYDDDDIITKKEDTCVDRKSIRTLPKLQKKQEKKKKMKDNKQQLSKNVFQGQHKWLGGGIDPQTGYIYGVPSHASFILCIQPSTPTTSPRIAKIHLPEVCRHGHFKWLRCIMYQGYMYGIPAWSTHGVLKVRLFESDPTLLNEDIKVSRQRVSILPLPSSTRTDDTTTIRDDTTMDENHSHNLQQQEYCSNKETTIPPLFVDRRNQPRTSPVDRTRWMWHGGQIGIHTPTGHKAIYCPPSNAKRVLKICLQTDTVSEIGPIFQQGQNKFYGGIVGNDGCIYGICYTAQQILRINPTTDEVKLIGPIFPYGGYKWHGGLKAHTGVIYAFPAHATTVLCINTNPTKPCSTTNTTTTCTRTTTQVESTITSSTTSGVVKNETKDDEDGHHDDDDDDDWRVYTIPIHRGKDDTDSLDLRYKWLGGSYGANGDIFGMPSDANSILRIDPVTDTATTFGHVAGKRNKFQSGVLCPRDNSIYAVAADMDCVLRIKTDPNLPVVADTVCGGLGDVEDKFQGGFLAHDGKIYCIPENMPYVMVLTPGDEPQYEWIK